MDHGERMDGLYRWQRHVYDLTRPFFLFGRERLLAGLRLPAEGRVLEVGCGTARNLLLLARRFPRARLYGLDASREMLRTARRRVEAAGLGGRVVLARGLGEEPAAVEAFGAAPFHLVFFSYSLSMMADREAALGVALSVLAAGGELRAVDFWDQRCWPGLLRRAFRRWLSWFHVRPEPDPVEYLAGRARQEGARLVLRPLLYRYAFLAVYRRPASSAPA